MNTNTTANNTALTVTIKPQGVIVQVGNAGYLTEAAIRKCYGCTNTLAAMLVTGGVKLSKNPSLIRGEEQNPVELAAFFYRLQPLLQGGLEEIFSNKDSLPNLPAVKSDVPWKKPSRWAGGNLLKQRQFAKLACCEIRRSVEKALFENPSRYAHG